MGVLESLTSCAIWQDFDRILRIPRPSKHEEAVRQHVVSWAKDHGFRALLDAVGNVVVKVPASAGYENAPTVILQGHLDMVAEKSPDCNHDFLQDPIPAYIDGDWIRTRGTTLGADNGIGVAAAMAVATDKMVQHGPLELLFTIDEETGLTGAQGLDASLITGKFLLNLDSEEEGVFFVGCAGGANIEGQLAGLTRGAASGLVAFDAEICGLQGGHSGLNIVENRGNAVKLLSRVVDTVLQQCPDLRLEGFQGGTKHNAIPREAVARLWIAPGQADAAAAAFAAAVAHLQVEFGSAEAELTGHWRSATTQAGQEILDADSTRRVVNLLVALPAGVISMSRDFPGIVETSVNLATADIDAAGCLHVLLSYRSSVSEAVDGVLAAGRAMFALAGGVSEAGNRYPPWRPQPESELLRRATAAWTEEFGAAPQVTVIHAGLECGILLDKSPGLEAISFGPNMHGVHSPAERLSIRSTEKFYHYLGKLLGRLGSE